MTTNHHTPISSGAAANAATVNSPLAELDAEITSQDARLTAEEAASTSLDGRVTVNESDIDAAEADINALDTRLTAEEAKISLSGVAGEFVNSDGDSAVPVGTGDTNGHTVQADGVSLTQRANLNFTGNGVIVTDRTTATDVNIAKRNFTLEPIDLTTDVQGALPIANGGTGQITAQAAFEALAANGGEIGDRVSIKNVTQDETLVVGDFNESNYINIGKSSASSSGIKWTRGATGVVDTVIETDANEDFIIGINQQLLEVDRKLVLSIGNAGEIFRVKENGHFLLGTKSDIAKLGVAGIADEVQMEVRANATQTADINVLAADSGGVKKVYVDSDYNIFLQGPFPVLKLRGIGNNATGSKIRLTEASNFQGGYIHYDGAANRLNIGVHPSADEILSGDNPAISIARDSGNVTIAQGFGIAGVTPATQQAYIASPTNTQIRDILIAFGFMAAS